jgi:hypothetical protein
MLLTKYFISDAKLFHQQKATAVFNHNSSKLATNNENKTRRGYEGNH